MPTLIEKARQVNYWYYKYLDILSLREKIKGYDRLSSGQKEYLFRILQTKLGIVKTNLRVRMT